MKTLIRKLFLIAFLLGALSAPVIVRAGVNLLPACAVKGEICGLNDIVQTFVNFARLLLGFVGSAILFFFVYGGFVWLTSGGAAEKIKKGKDIIVNSIIGLVIVFAAFTVVQFVFQAFAANQQAQVGQECSSICSVSKTICDNNKDCPAGERCEKGDRGIVVINPDLKQTECVTSCENPILQKGGYSCMDPAQGTNCISGLCSGGVDSVCCQPTSLRP